MTTPDAPENRALEAATQISAHVAQLWTVAHTDGIRTGMEIAAQMLDGAATETSSIYGLDSAIRDGIIAALSVLSDQMRLSALQMPDPETQPNE